MENLFDQSMKMFNGWVETQQSVSEQMMKTWTTANKDPMGFQSAWKKAHEQMTQNFTDLGKTWSTFGVPAEVLEKWKTEFKDGEAFVEKWESHQKLMNETFQKLGETMQKLSGQFSFFNPEGTSFFASWSENPDLWSTWMKQQGEMGKILQDSDWIPNFSGSTSPEQLKAWLDKQPKVAQHFIDFGENLLSLVRSAMSSETWDAQSKQGEWFTAQKELGEQFIALGKSLHEWVLQFPMKKEAA